MSNAFRIKDRNGGRDGERETGIKWGARDTANKCNKIKDGEMSAQKVEGISGGGGERKGKIEGD